MTSPLRQAILAKYGTPQRAMHALGLPASLLRANDAGRRSGRARDQEPGEADLGQALASGEQTFSQRCALVLQYLKGKGVDPEIALKVEQLLRGDQEAIDEIEEAVEAARDQGERDGEPRAMDARRLGSGTKRSRQLTARIGIA